MPPSAAVLSLLLLLTAAGAQAAERPLDIFETVWREAKAGIYLQELATKHFTDSRYEALKAQAATAEDLYALTPLINDFLAELGVSHTRFYDDRSLAFYLFRSMFTTRALDDPPVRHIGIQHATVGGAHVVRELLHGYPAARAGLRRGDILLQANGEAYAHARVINPPGGTVDLLFRRNDAIRRVAVETVHENPNRSFHDAMLNSAATFRVAGRDVGYVHLWSGTHPRILRSFTALMRDRFAGHDAMVLDLRGGYGGAWYDYLDPFFPDRTGYYRFAVHDRHGRSEHRAEPKTNPHHFAGPMVVLINEGTRSGKEALAYQFKATGRAPLIGATTRGAFLAGRAIFTDPAKPYFLFLAAAEPRLDGNRLEGRGVDPDIAVAYPLDRSSATDPQLAAALGEIARQLRAGEPGTGD